MFPVTMASDDRPLRSALTTTVSRRSPLRVCVNVTSGDISRSVELDRVVHVCIPLKHELSNEQLFTSIILINKNNLSNQSPQHVYVIKI